MTRFRAELLMLSIAMAWGMSWIFMKMGLEDLPVFSIVFLRFGVAFVVVAIIFLKHLKRLNAQTVLSALVSGSLLCAVVVCVLYGLGVTMASTGAFLISTTTVFVACFQALLVKKLPGLDVIIATLCCVLGVAFLSNANLEEFDIGSLWIVFAAFLNALYIVFVGWAGKKEAVDSLNMGIIQLGVAGVIAGVASLVTSTLVIPSTVNGWVAVLGLALVCTAYCFVLQPVVQVYSTPERTGIIWSTESLFSAIFAFILLGEVLSGGNIFGATLIMSGVVIALIDWKKFRKIALFLPDKS